MAAHINTSCGHGKISTYKNRRSLGHLSYRKGSMFLVYKYKGLLKES